MGWKMGGAIGTVLAEQIPALLHRLDQQHTTPCLVQRPDWEPAIPPANAQGLGELLVRDWNAGAAAFAELVVSEPDQPEARTLVREAAERANPAVNLACFGTVGGEDRRGVLDAVSVPVDVICGTADLVCPPAASSYLAKVTAGSLTWIDGAGHAPFLTAREPFVAAVRSALS
jgi:pimeloyl-[acyl-carrier protein] methyl ester esterase